MALVIRDLVPHSILIFVTQEIHDRTKNGSRNTGSRPTLTTDITLHKKYTREKRMALIIRDMVPHTILILRYTRNTRENKESLS